MYVRTRGCTSEQTSHRIRGVVDLPPKISFPRSRKIAFESRSSSILSRDEIAVIRPHVVEAGIELVVLPEFLLRGDSEMDEVAIQGPPRERRLDDVGSVQAIDAICAYYALPEENKNTFGVSAASPS